MTRISSAFAGSYNSASLRTKTFELAGHTFKVRIPLTKELEDIQSRIEKIDQADAQSRYEKMTASFRDSNAIEGVVVTDEDVVVEGRSTRELVKSIIQMETRTLEYMKLLVPDVGDFDNLTYADIDEEFPLPVQLEILSKIAETIQPGYKDSRKN